VVVRITVNDRLVDMLPALILMFADGYILVASQPAT
jgi:hypothetical protein